MSSLVIEPSTRLDSQVIDVELDVAGRWGSLDEFLADPIAYGQYDWSDPIGLDEFIHARPFRGSYAAPLVF